MIITYLLMHLLIVMLRTEPKTVACEAVCIAEVPASPNVHLDSQLDKEI